MTDRPLNLEEIVERMAWKICAQENEIWDEAPQSYRDRWRREASQLLIRPDLVAALQVKP